MWLRSLLRGRKDPYWDAYLSRPPSDPKNLVAPAVRGAPEGQVFPVKSDVHTPEIMTEHIRALGQFFGADWVGVAALSGEEAEYTFAVVCGIKAEYDPRSFEGIGGQAAALTGSYVVFNLSAAIREYGFSATRSGDEDVERIAACAGLNTDRRPAGSDRGQKLYLTDVIRTNLPLQTTGREIYEWVRHTS